MREVLLDKRSLERPYIDKSFLEQCVETHIRGESDYTNEIASALTAELVNRFFVDSP